MSDPTALPSPDLQAQLVDLKRGVFTSAVAILGRQVTIRIVAIGASILLARWIGPADFGTFAILTYLAFSIPQVVGNFGLGLALVQKAEAPSDRELRQVLAVQALILMASAILAATLGPTALELLGLGPSRLVALWSLLLALGFRLARSVPSALLERGLAFPVLMRIEVVETLLYYGVVLTAAYRGSGVESLVWATVAKEAVGCVMVIWRAPSLCWRPIATFEGLRPLLEVGGPYQLAALATFATQSFPAVVIASRLGPEALGYVTWASATSLHVLFMASSLDRLWLPTYSRLQSNPESLRNGIHRTIRLNVHTVVPATAVLLSLAPAAVSDLYGARWLPGVFLLYAYGLAAVFSAVGFPILNALVATGRTKATLYMALGYMTVAWGIGYPAVYILGLEGWGWTYAVLQCAYLPVFFYAARVFSLRLFATVGRPMIMGATLLFIGHQLQSHLNLSGWRWVFVAVGLWATYFLGLSIVLRDRVLWEIRDLLGDLRNHLVRMRATRC